MQNSIASDPRDLAVTESLDDNHMMSSSDKSIGTISGTYSYSSKEANMGSSTGGTRILGCFYRIISTTGCPVLVKILSERRHPPLL